MTSSTLLADPPSNETIDVFYINNNNNNNNKSIVRRNTKCCLCNSPNTTTRRASNKFHSARQHSTSSHCTCPHRSSITFHNIPITNLTHCQSYDTFYSQCSRQHVSTTIAAILRVILLLLLLQKYKRTNVFSCAGDSANHICTFVFL